MNPLAGRIAAVVLISLSLAACGTINDQVRSEVEQTDHAKRPVVDTPFRIAPQSRVSEVRSVLIPVSPVAISDANPWLKQLKIQLDVRNPTPLSSVVSMVAQQGVNVVAELPLDSYTYVGKVNATDAESALELMLGSVGLDFQVDNARKIVVITPMASRSWFLNIGNRKSTYSSDGTLQASSAPTSSGTGANGGLSGAPAASNAGGASATGGTGNSAQPGMAGSGAASGQSIASPTASSTAVASQDDFWSSLASELQNRLMVMVPRSMGIARQNGDTSLLPPVPGIQAAPMLPPAGLGPNLTAGELYTKRQIGTYSLNPETGSVTVQAPHWVLAELDSYLKRCQEMYNTDIAFAGELVLVTSTRTDSEGFDLAAFGRWARGKYGAVVSNNALGGVTVTLPTGGGAPVVQAAAQSVAGPLLGLTYSGPNNALDLFNAYLSEQGKVSVIQRPLISTTSGVPGVFRKFLTDYYNTVTQQAASAGVGSAATATQNVLVPVQTGTELRINPRLDVATGLIRAQLTLNEVVLSGTRTVPQTITFGNNASTVNTTIPLLTVQNISGEVLLRDGDLIVVGGQVEESRSVDENGLPGPDSPFGGLIGVKKASHDAQTYYFALRVVVSKRN